MSYRESAVKMTDERALAIVNDIHEGIDAGEGRIVLRAALSHLTLYFERRMSEQSNNELAKRMNMLKAFNPKEGY